MAKNGLSIKHLQIDKANTRVVVVVALSIALVIFCLVATRALLATRSYQSRVIDEKEKAVKQLRANLAAVDTLKTSYEEFIARSENTIGGSASGQGERDGDNAKIILDALPSKYDFPALTASLEKLATQQGFTIEDIAGTDDEIAQADNNSPDPQPVEMPFELSVSGSYGPLESLLQLLEKSIRPIQPQTITISATGQGDDDVVKIDYAGKTYYMPGKNLSITTKDVR